MASNSNSSIVDASENQLVTLIILGVRYTVPKEVAELLKPSKSNLQVSIFNHKSVRFIDFCAGMWSVGERDRIDVSGIVNGVGSDVVIEEVKEGGCMCGPGLVGAEEEEVEIIEAVPMRNPEGVEESCDSEYWNNEIDGFEPSVGEEISAGTQILDKLVALGKIAKFNRSEGSDDMDCEIVQPTQAISKRKKKELPMRIQPTRDTGKRKQIVKEELVSAKSVKRPRRSKSGKEILQEVECSEEFLNREGLTEVLELLKMQGWENLCASKDFVCPEVVEDFYKDLKMSIEPVPTLEVNFRGNEFTLSSIELADLLGLKHEGFDYFCKSSVWPKEVADKKELVEKICNLKTVQKKTGISTQCMDPNVKILHKILVSNFLQRGVKPSYVQHQDLLLLDKLLNREKINLPKMIIHQIDHLKNLTQIGYSRVIKRVLLKHNLYEVSSAVEEQIVKEFDPEVFIKMHLVKDDVEGWIKAPVQEPKPKAKPVLQQIEEEDEDETEDYSHKKWDLLEKGIMDMRRDLRALTAEVREMKDAMIEVQDALLVLAERT